MTRDEQVQHYRALIATYRRNLAHAETRAAQFGGEVFAPTDIASDFTAARNGIAQCVAALRELGAPETDNAQTQAAGSAAPASKPRVKSRGRLITEIVVPIVVALIGSVGFWQYLQQRNNSTSQLCQINAAELSLERAVIEVNESVIVSIRVDNPNGRPLLYNWQAVYGKMNPGLRSSTAQSTYTTPFTPVDDTISVDITLPDCQPIRRSQPISVIAQSAPVSTGQANTSVSLSTQENTTTLTQELTEPIVPATPVLSFEGTWHGEYFFNEDLSGSPAVVREDKAINFVWNGQPPDSRMSFEHWSARWTTTHCFKNNPVSFYTEYDDGIKISIDGEVIKDALNGPSDKLWIDRNVSSCPTIVVEYRQSTGDAYVKFGWHEPSQTSDSNLPSRPEPSPMPTPTLQPPTESSQNRTPSGSLIDMRPKNWSSSNVRDPAILTGSRPRLP